ncbi:MAG: hypothetical protein ACKVW3_04515 [Phycisphaerales bacterium]
MKLKGINPLEQHVEKLVLVGVSAVFLIVVAMQFLLEPNRVKVGTQEMPPGRAFDPIEQKAAAVRVAIEAKELDLPKPPEGDLLSRFEKKLSGGLGPRTTLPPLGQTVALQGSGPAVLPRDSSPLAEPNVPAPANVLAIAQWSTFDPALPLNVPELKELLPKAQPLDAPWVTVEATFSGIALKAALAADPDGEGGARALPPNWWRDNTEILGVNLERQEQLSSGDWSEPMSVIASPGRTSLTQRLRTVRAPEDLADVVAEARELAEDLLRPEFYPTIAGDEWMAPADAMKKIQAAKDPELERLNRQRKDAEDQVDRAKIALENLDRQPGAAPRPPPGGGGGGGKGGGGAGGGGGPPGREPQNDPKVAHRQRLEKQLKDREEALAKIDLQIEEKMKAADPAQAGTPAPGAPLGAIKSLLDEASVRLWAFDMSARPGKTYRYRVSVSISNPVFGRGASLMESQQSLAKSAQLASAASDWSEPLAVMSDRYFAITSASPPDSLGPARASGEVYQFFYGYYRKGSVTLEPGDTIVAQVKLPDPNKIPVFDVTQPAGPEGAPPLPPPPGPGGREMMPPPIPPGRGNAPGGRGNLPGGRPEGGAEPSGPEQPQAVVLPTNAKPWKDPVILREPVTLLDVAALATGNEGTGPRSQVLLRLDNGQISQRHPEADREAPWYKIVQASVKAGETQGQPVIPDPSKTRPIRPPPRQQREQRPPRQTPGGGGGGGDG